MLTIEYSVILCQYQSINSFLLRFYVIMLIDVSVYISILTSCVLTLSARDRVLGIILLLYDTHSPYAGLYSSHFYESILVGYANGAFHSRNSKSLP